MTPAAGGNPNSSPRSEPSRPARRGPKLHRVHDRRTHGRLRRSRRVRRGPLTVACVVEPGSGPPRVAFAIGRNVGGAVHRNRARRRLRAVMSEFTAELSGRAWLVGAGPEALECDYATLRASAETAIRQLAK